MVQRMLKIAKYRNLFTPILLIIVFLSHVDIARPAEVVVLGNVRLKPVVQVIDGIRDVFKAKPAVYEPSQVKNGKLGNIVKKDGAEIVVALGQEAIDEALSLPPSVIVLYGLVILPPKTSRPNTAGVYMGTPIREYLKVVDSYLPNLKNISVIGSPEVLEVLDHSNRSHLTTYQAKTAFDFISIVKDIDRADALLLLPDISLLTRTALEESYLFSFRKKVPLLGISKKHVRQGALFALEFDPKQLGRHLGTMIQAAQEGKVFEHSQAQPSESFSLYINRETAQKMKIAIPEEMIKVAAGVYP